MCVWGGGVFLRALCCKQKGSLRLNVSCTLYLSAVKKKSSRWSVNNILPHTVCFCWFFCCVPSHPIYIFHFHLTSRFQVGLICLTFWKTLRELLPDVSGRYQTVPLHNHYLRQSKLV